MMRNWRTCGLVLFFLGIILVFGGMMTSKSEIDTQELWERVARAEKDGLPQTAIGHLKEIYGICLGAKDYDEALRALLKQIVFESIVQGNQPEAKIVRLREEIQKAPASLQPLMKVVLAQWFRHYYDRNRWRFMERSRTAGLEEGDVEDFTTWDLPRLFREISSLYQEALAREAELKAVPIGAYREFLQAGNLPEDLRPTLFDFIVFEALDFYTSPEQAAARPEDAFEIEADSPALSAVPAFLDYRPRTTDTDSPQYQALLLFQKVIRFHQQKQNRDALIDADLHRLHYVWNTAVGEGKAERYIKRLREIVDRYADSPLSSLARYYWASALKGEDRLVEALKIARQGHQAYPDSRGGTKCSRLAAGILEKEYQLKAEQVVTPRQASRLALTYKNIETLNFRIVKDHLQDYIDEKEGRRWGWISPPVVLEMLQSEPAAQWTAELPPTEDYREKQALITVPPLEPGLYRIFASYRPDFSREEKGNKIQQSLLWVSRMALISRGRESRVEGYVVDNGSGKPIEKTEVTVYEYDHRSRHYQKKETMQSDSSGYFSFASPTGYRRRLLVTRHGDGSEYAEADVPSTYYRQDQPYEKTLFFTDRSLYRPGQMVHFKGICLKVDQKINDYQLLTGRGLTVYFRDGNDREITKLRVQTNDFGSFQGTFTAPGQGLTGVFHITTDNPRGSAHIRVEEYKRPKFQVSLEIPTQEFRLNDQVSVTGEALAYTGAPIDGAKVVYRVFRQVKLPPWWYWYGIVPIDGSAQEIDHGTLETDEKGQFTLKFTARPDLKVPPSSQPIFTFRIQADVTDSSGETRSAEEQVRAGYAALTANMECEAWQEESRPVEISLEVTTLNGKAVDAEGVVEIFALKGPDRPVPADLIGEVAIPRQSAQTSATPEWQKWPEGERVGQRPFRLGADKDTDRKITFNLKKGAYRVLLKTRDKYDRPVEAKLPILVFGAGDKRFPLAIPFYHTSRKEEVPVGETYQALWGTGYAQGPMLVEIFRDNRRVDRYWTDSRRSQGLISIPVTETVKGGFTVVVHFVKENRCYREETRVDVPWLDKRLDIQWQTFRSLLQPGQPETWSLQIKGPGAEEAAVKAAEMVATLYDVSLDQFYPHHFSGFSGIFRRERTYLGDRFSNRAMMLTTASDRLNPRIKLSPEIYVHFPDEIVEDLFGFGFSRRGDVGVEGGVVGGVAETAALEEAPAPPAAARVKKRNGGDEGEADGEKQEPAPPAEIDLSKVSARKNLQETAFFYPQLLSDEDGVVTIQFKMPEALTQWRFIGFAHTRDLAHGKIEGLTRTRKELMVQPQAPRFLREGDRLAMTVKVTNMADEAADGTVELHFFDPRSEEDLSPLLKNKTKGHAFSIPAGQSRSYSWPIEVADGLEMVGYRAVAATAAHSDGEEGIIPVLSRYVFVQESLPLWISGKGTKNFRFEKLLGAGGSSTLKHQRLVLQMVSNPAWYAVQALPFLMEFPYECSEQVFSRVYANALAQKIAQSDPKIRRIFDLWKGTEALTSPLEKNEALKSVCLQETPWLAAAKNESENRRKVGLLFDENRLAMELGSAFEKLKKMQYPDGSWPWFDGGPSSRFITLHIVTGFGRLKHLGVSRVSQEPALKALDYLDDWLQDYYEKIVQQQKTDQDHLSPAIAMYLYGRSFYLTEKPIAAKHRQMVSYFLDQAEKYWLQLESRLSQAHLALALHRLDRLEGAVKIMRSLKERSLWDEEMGRYWGESGFGWWWYHAPIETQALMIEAFAEVMQDQAAVEECKIWLLKQKQTQNWKTTKATTDAVYSLLLRGEDLLASDALVEVSLGSQTVKPQKVEAGTGFYEKYYLPQEIKPTMGKITLKKVDEGIGWGGLHWQYLEDVAQITPHRQNPLRLTKRLFVQKYTEKGPVISPLKGSLSVGDLLKVRLELRVDRDMEYIHLKDHRGSGTEPVNVLSQYKFQDGLYYYESTKDTASHFFIDYLPRGTYVFEYPLRVVHRGTYHSGMAHIECMYAPEFNSHSQSILLKVD
jgi:uncharacterized protein YfaS (alpha-2-macroglobulin family)